MRHRLIVGSGKGKKGLGIGMWMPYLGGEKAVAMGQTENDQAEDKLDDISETDSGACAYLI